MRLIEYSGGRFALTKELLSNVPAYAILSHTWSQDPDEEVTFQDMRDGTGQNKAGYKKIRFCAEQAQRDGLRHFWIDTCCIDKSDSSELTRAINSMFNWYKNAARCYVYLSGFSRSDYESASYFSSKHFLRHRWFTRGWTLQELLAPASVEFFTEDGSLVGDKSSLADQISKTTRIPAAALRERDLSNFDIDERFKWAETRETTYEEDWAYSLLGLFGVFMPLIPGEGKMNAVRRLRNEINNAIGYVNKDRSAPAAFDPLTVRCLQTVKGCREALAFSPDSRLLAVVGEESTRYSVRILETATGHLQHELSCRHNIRAIAFSPNGRLLATAGHDAVRLWDPATGQQLGELERWTSPSFSLAFSPDSRLLAATSSSVISIWDPVAPQTKPDELGERQDPHFLFSVAFSPDGRLLASASVGKTIKLWDPATRRHLQTLSNDERIPVSIAFSPDSRLLAATADKDIRVLDPTTGRCLQTLCGHLDNTQSVAFSPDSRVLASASVDYTVKLWDPATAQCLRTLSGHTTPVQAVAFSPDGRFLASVGWDTVRLWG